MMWVNSLSTNIELAICTLVCFVLRGGKLDMAACILNRLSRGIEIAAKCKGLCSYFHS